MAAIASANMWPLAFSDSSPITKAKTRVESMCHVAPLSKEASVTRRSLLGSGSVVILALVDPNSNLWVSPARAEKEEEVNASEEKEEGVMGAIKSLFDPNEKTKSGKVLPKDYLKSAREVVKTLRESLKEDTKDMAKFRRNADAAKESIREYINSWRGQKAVVNEESYVMLEKAIRTLAGFYSKAGPSATLPEEIKNEILKDLTSAEDFL